MIDMIILKNHLKPMQKHFFEFKHGYLCLCLTHCHYLGNYDYSSLFYFDTLSDYLLKSQVFCYFK